MTRRLIYSLPEAAPRAVAWRGPMFNQSGYAEEMRGFVTTLRRMGEPVTALPQWSSRRYVDGLSPSLRAELEGAVAEPSSDHPVQVLHLPAQALYHVRDAPAHVARSMFETDGLPGDWTAKLNAMDEVWVPSSFNVETFRRAGVTVPLHVVPGGVDPDLYRPGVTPLPIDGLSGTVFLSVFEWSFRKGWDILLRAWAEAFDRRDDVTLLLRTYPQQDFDGQRPADEIERRINTYLRKIGRSRRQVAPIVVLQNLIEDEDMPALYAAATAYVSPTRGEGSGRPFLEALSAGLPVIATRWSGHLEFLDDDNSMLLDIEGLEAIDSRQELPFYRGQRWARPSVSHLAQLLRAVAEDPSGAGERGSKGRADVLERFSWQKVSELAAARLDELQKRLRPPRRSTSDAPRVRWIGDQWAQHSLSRVNREWCSRLASTGALDLEVLTHERPKVERGVPALGALERATGPVLASPPQVEVRHQWPPDWTPPEHGAWVAVQPWEFGGLPDSWIVPLRDEVDEVWCYSTYVRDVYLRSGVPGHKLHIVPCGVDTTLFHPAGVRSSLPTSKSFKFLFVGGTIPRKGIDVLLSAYTAAFGPDDDVCLVIKSTGSTDSYRTSAVDDRIRSLAEDPRLPAIHLLDDELSDEDLAALFRSCDALVHPYRGEGFALPVAEAMASGLPVVVTARGACADFCDDSNAYLLSSTPVPVDVNDAGTSAAGYWCEEPDADELRRLMQEVVADQRTARAKGLAGRQRIVDDFSWDRAASIIAERCRALAGRVPVRFIPRQRDSHVNVTPGAFPSNAILVDDRWETGCVETVIREFAGAWRPGTSASLLVRIPADCELDQQAAAARVRTVLQNAGIDGEGGPDILLLDGVDEPRQLDELYSGVTAVIDPGVEDVRSRAERVGTPIAARPSDAAAWAQLLAEPTPPGVLSRSAAGELAESGRLQEAADMLRDLLEADPEDPGVLSDLAVVCYHLGHVADSLELLDRALSVAPEHADAAENHKDLLELASGQPELRQVHEQHARQCAWTPQEDPSPVDNPKLLRLNLGAGDDRRDGYVNVDLRVETADLVADVRKLPLADGAAKEILAHDVLEHFWRDTIPSLLAEWNRALCPGGLLRVRVPNLPVLASLIDGPEHDQVIENIYGGHRWGPEGSYDTHHWGWSQCSLVRDLESAGFDVQSIDNEPNMTAMAVKRGSTGAHAPQR
jgi:glycosyltransferase involved in cell wall biosynthesis